MVWGLILLHIDKVAEIRLQPGRERRLPPQSADRNREVVGDAANRLAERLGGPPFALEGVPDRLADLPDADRPQ